MARGLAAGSTVTVHAVRGMGGVVKIQLAVECAFAHSADYDLMWWIAAEEPASIPDQFAALAARLGLDPVADPEALRGQGHDALRGGQSLLPLLRFRFAYPDLQVDVGGIALCSYLSSGEASVRT